MAKNRLEQMGLVRIPSWYPTFNGSHFDLPPSEIHRMTGLPPKITCTMTYWHRPHCRISHKLIWCFFFFFSFVNLILLSISFSLHAISLLLQFLLLLVSFTAKLISLLSLLQLLFIDMTPPLPSKALSLPDVPGTQERLPPSSRDRQQ